MLRILCVAFAAVFITPTTAHASALSDLAASMTEGEWAELQTNYPTPEGYDQGFFYMPTPWHAALINYGDSMVWDPTSKAAYFVGGAHAPEPNEKFIKYDEASNTWVEEGDMLWLFGTDYWINHPYDHNVIDQSRGHLYYRPFNSIELHRYEIATETWTQMADMETNVGATGALVFSPEMDGIVAIGSWGVFFWDRASNAWSTIDDTVTMNGIHQVAQYSPVDGLVLFNQGDGAPTKMYSLDASGTVTPVADAPFGVGCSPSYGRLSVDPIRGDFIAVASSDGAVAAYDVALDSWSDQGTAPFTDQVLETPIPEHGVIMYLSAMGAPIGVFLYKHSVTCTTGAERACGVGPCAGMQSCVNDVWASCDGPAPAQEICGDGIDQDCNGADLACPPDGGWPDGGGPDGASPDGGAPDGDSPDGGGLCCGEDDPPTEWPGDGANAGGAHIPKVTASCACRDAGPSSAWLVALAVVLGRRRARAPRHP